MEAAVSRSRSRYLLAVMPYPIVPAALLGQAIESAGGWEIDTVVEDMDLSLRAYLAGWRGLYLPHVGCINEVPDDLSTYKTQQYRCDAAVQV